MLYRSAVVPRIMCNLSMFSIERCRIAETFIYFYIFYVCVVKPGACTSK